MNFNIWRNFHFYVLLSILTLIIVGQNGCALKNGTSKSTGLFFTDIGSFSSEDEALFRGWEYFKNKDYSKAGVIFNYLAEHSSGKYQEDSLAGLGWVNLRSGEDKEALSYFEKAGKSLFASVGLAVYYLLNNQDGSYIKDVISKLQNVVKEKDLSTLKDSLGISEAQVNALLGYFYALQGNNDLAVSYGKKAKEINPTEVSDILDSISTIVGVEF